MQDCRRPLQGDAFLAILDLAICHVNSVYTLAQISAVSKRCRAICSLQVRHQFQALLLPVLRQAAAKPSGPLQEQQLSSIQWLCHVAGRGAVEAASDAIIEVPGTPLKTAQLLTDAGLRVTAAAVTAAALKQHKHVEWWLVTKIKAHGVSTNEPEEYWNISHSAEQAAEDLKRSVAAAAVPPLFLLELLAMISDEEEVGAKKYHKDTTCKQ
jgi:hypothetical protein